MLSSGSSSSQTSYTNPRQIAASGSADSQIMYTVPAGKKFQGTMHAETVNRYMRITPSGGAAVNFSVPTNITSGASSSAFPVTLVAGSIVANVSSGASTYLIGVETDA